MFCNKFSAISLKYSLASSSKNFTKTLQRLLSASVAGNNLQIKGDDGKTMKFPDVWLRDNCQCDECFHSGTKTRVTNWERTIVDARMERIDTINDKQISINWSDKHKSIFDINWLSVRDFSPENRKRHIEEIYRPSPQIWSKEEYKQVLKTFQYSDVLQNDDDLLACINALAIQGFAIIKNATDDTLVSRKLANRIGYTKRTTYGEEFEVKSKENARNYAYLMTPLPLHTDMPYYEYKAGINILHCYVQSQSKGGANLMTDGFSIAQKLSKNYPKYYDILKNTPVDWFDIGKDGDISFYNIWRSPVICLDIDGRFCRINHNATKRDSHFTVTLEQVGPWYEAYDKFLQLAYAEAVEFKTVPGEVFVFNNLRMLHGRTAYEDSPENKRHLIGTYVDWDIIYSNMRMLNLKLK